LADLDKRYRGKGLQMIGAHVQQGTPEEIKKVAAKAGAKFTMTNGASGPSGMSGIPHAVLFDAEGKMIFDGHPAGGEFEKLLKREVRDLGKSGDDKPGALAPSTGKPTVLVEEREWTNTEGNKMKAALVSVQGDTAVFKRADGKTFNYAVSKLNDDDQKLIKEAGQGGNKPAAAQ
jgi:hypothetical protein